MQRKPETELQKLVAINIRSWIDWFTPEEVEKIRDMIADMRWDE